MKGSGGVTTSGCLRLFAQVISNTTGPASGFALRRRQCSQGDRMRAWASGGITTALVTVMDLLGKPVDAETIQRAALGGTWGGGRPRHARSDGLGAPLRGVAALLRGLKGPGHPAVPRGAQGTRPCREGPRAPGRAGAVSERDVSVPPQPSRSADGGGAVRVGAGSRPRDLARPATPASQDFGTDAASGRFLNPLPVPGLWPAEAPSVLAEPGHRAAGRLSGTTLPGVCGPAWASQGRYIGVLHRPFRAGLGLRPSDRLPFPRHPRDPRAISDPRLILDEFPDLVGDRQIAPSPR
jgi:hypothetical protein